MRRHPNKTGQESSPRRTLSQEIFGPAPSSEILILDVAYIGQIIAWPKEPNPLGFNLSYPSGRPVVNRTGQLRPEVTPYITDLPRLYLGRGGVADLAVKLICGKSGPDGEQSLAPPVDANAEHKNLDGADFNIRLTFGGTNCRDILGCGLDCLRRKRQRW